MLSFWEALSPAEQSALSSLASLEAFAAGDRLMREGDQADHVMVIIEGRTRVCVDENGWERVLAERGPGQLIGERGGLQVRIRSASVIALEAVRVMTVRTEDFTTFVDTHPRVFDIVESQLYDRLTQATGGYLDHVGADAVTVNLFSSRPATVSADTVPAAKDAAPPLRGQNCTILFSDVVAFSSRERNDDDRLIIRRALLGMTVLALRGIPGAWSQDRGDGLLTVIPPIIPTANVIALLHKQLPAALDRHNSTDRTSTRFQLRIAVNVGPVTSDTIGVSGEAIIIAARLLDAPVFKKAMAKTSANFGIIASPFVYETVIRHSMNPIDLAGYSRVQVNVKESTTPAWVTLFGVPASAWYSSPPAASDSFGALLTTCGAAAYGAASR
jgi:class 3 adenylate cyclase